METYAGYMQMGAQPVAGRARSMHACASGRSTAFAAAASAAHASWFAGVQAKPLTTRIAVPDTNGTRRSRGTP